MISIDLPLIGLRTCAIDLNDVPVAISESIIGFYLLAEKYGDGFEKELMRCIKK